MNTKKMGRPKGSGMIEPTPVHRLMMELASSSGDIKYANLRQIGEIVAESIGRKKPFSKQYVKQVMDRWKGSTWEDIILIHATAAANGNFSAIAELQRCARLADQRNEIIRVIQANPNPGEAIKAIGKLPSI